MTVPGNLSSPLLATAAAAAAAAAGPTRSLRFNSGDSAYLNRTPSSSGNRRTMTISFWYKNTVKTTSGQQPFLAGQFTTPTKDFYTMLSKLQDGSLFFSARLGGSDLFTLRTSQVLRDPGAWYSIILAIDTTQATAANRVKFYINGSQVTDFQTETYPSQNKQMDYLNENQLHFIGRRLDNSYEYFDGYLADFYFIDGSQLEPTSFGAYDDNGVWQAAAYSGTFGTNGFHLLDFANEATVGHDSSGNENDFTANNFSTSAGAGNDVLFDVPTNGAQSDTGAGGEVSGNYCTWNPLDQSGITFSNGNLDTTGSGMCKATFGLASGKWYWEQTVITKSDGANNPRSGVATAAASLTNDLGAAANQWVMFMAGGSNGGKGYNNSTITGSGSAFAVNDVAMFAYDADAEKLWFGRNGTWITGDPAAGSTPFYSSVTAPVFPVVQQGSSSTVSNWGQRSFSYSAPSGFKALCTTNLPTPTIADGSAHFETKLYGGNGGSKRIGGSTTAASSGVTATGTGGVSGISSTYPIAGAFDGATSTYLATNSANISSTAAVLTVTFPSGNQPSYSSSVVLEVWAGTADTVKVAINGGSYQTVSASSNDWQRHTVASGSGTITEIKVSRQKSNTNDGAAEIRAIIVDGIQLLDGNADNLSFRPDFTWIKPRSVSDHHILYDAVRGVRKQLYTTLTNAEETETQGLLAFNPDGFTVGGTHTVRGQTNDSGKTYASWNWNAGANSNKTYTVTVVSDSGNKYRFDGHGTSAVTLDLAEGSTYIFDQSDSSNAGHPLRFSTTSNGSHGGGSEYTTGVTATGTPGQAGAKTTIVVAAGAPTLYYYCTAHSGMGGQINTNSTAGSTRLSGSENSSLYNQSATWTNDVTTNSGTSWFAGTPANAFDGSTSTSVQGAVGHDLTFTPTTGIAVTSSMRIWADSGSGFGVGNGPYTITYNGSQIYSGSMWSSPYTITAAAGTTFSSLVIAPSGGEAMRLFAVEIDGRLLVNSNVTLAAVPSINSVVKANPTAGFSIINAPITSSGGSIAHGLNASPSMIIVKNRDTSSTNWVVWHEALGTNGYLLLNSSAAKATSSNLFDGTSSSTFTVGSGFTSSGTNDHICYCFAPVANYSKFGSYTGNSSSDGTFVYTGFKPAWILLKRTDSGIRTWEIHDTARSPGNVSENNLIPNVSNAESSGSARLDILSNGFKLRTSSNGINNGNIIYAAFAENPFSSNGGLAR